MNTRIVTVDRCIDNLDSLKLKLEYQANFKNTYRDF